MPPAGLASAGGVSANVLYLCFPCHQYTCQIQPSGFEATPHSIFNDNLFYFFLKLGFWQVCVFVCGEKQQEDQQCVIVPQWPFFDVFMYFTFWEQKTIYIQFRKTPNLVLQTTFLREDCKFHDCFLFSLPMASHNGT